jgi:predicted MPP superfamily phosphohydrolase
LLRPLQGRLGSFAILGNHDMVHQPGEVLRHLEDAGYTTLEGRWATLTCEGGTLVLGGTSHPWGPVPSLDDRPTGDVSILLSHVPDRFSWSARAGFDLMLAGHNHGGQIRLPLIGAVFMPSRYSRRFDRGYFRCGDLTLHVSQGISGLHPVRYGCVPEVSRIVLRAAPRLPDRSEAETVAQDEPGWQDARTY